MNANCTRVEHHKRSPRSVRGEPQTLKMSVVLEYLRNCSIHGFRYICKSGIHWTERVFWIVSLAFSVAGSVYVTIKAYQSYQKEAVSFTTETNYLSWNTNFPAVTVCEQRDYQRVKDFVAEMHPNSTLTDMNFYITMYEEIAFFRHQCYLCTLKSNYFRWPSTNLYSIARKIRDTCTNILLNCSWNEVNFTCCSKFKELLTEFGPCFSINSLQLTKYTSKDDKLYSNQTTGPGKLEFEVSKDVEIFVHSRDGVPNWNSILGHVTFLERGYVLLETYNVLEVVNDWRIEYVPLSTRRCHVPSEAGERNYYSSASYETCRIQCRTEMMMEVCKCVHHFAPVKGNRTVCDAEGLQCVTDNYDDLMKIKINGEPFGCVCLPSCDESELRKVSSIVYEHHNPKKSLVSVSLANLPKIRLKRVVVRDLLDFVVSVGGIIGLFLGASILSFAEIIYYFTIRRAH